MSIDRARQHLAQFGADGRIRETPQSSATVELAAAAIGTQPCRIAKTLSFWLPDGPILVVVAGDARIDNRAYIQRFGTKARMLKPDEVEATTGHVVGGVCPFGVKAGVRIFLDESLRRFETVFPACGSGNSSIEVTINELERFSGYDGWVQVTKLPDGEENVGS